MIFYSRTEDIFNSLTHAAGFVGCVVAGLMLIDKCISAVNIYALVGAVLFAVGASASYLISAIYHAWPTSDTVTRETLRVFDHAAIYWHIAGAYSTVTLTTLACSGWWGGGLFAFIWGAALLGTYTSFQGLKEHSNLETVVYCIMGLSVLAVFHVFVKCLSMAAVWWLLAEGAAYLTGAVMYAYSHNRPYVHTLFHIFVIAGTACHVMATLEVFKDYV